jgi:maltooligosyltrehalose trehalohydrolase
MIHLSPDRLGARALAGGGARFRVWAPRARRVEIELAPAQGAEGRREEMSGADERREEMTSVGGGYFELDVAEARPGTRYSYRLDSGPARPDPASRSQPEGVHGPSQVVTWPEPVEATGWRGLPLEEYVLYELHVGSFTEEGTFAAVIPRLAALVELGVTAVELMPVAQFPGTRNWGYDGVQPFAAQDSYGGPAELRRLVDACHETGLAVVLDVVYNHLGPEGNYLAEFGPYFTPVYHTPWGEAINFDGRGSDEVRRYFIENALWWTLDMGFDALRLDAVHAIIDRSAQPFLGELAAEVHAAARGAGRRIHLIAESDANDNRLLLAPEQGGFGLDAQWNDDFHHALHSLLTSEQAGYYGSFGRVEHLARAYQEGFVYSGQFSPYRGRRHGSPSQALGGGRFVVYAQNHDQIGNRAQGERLAALLPFEALKATTAAVLLSPFLPLLFMGEEYAEESPFLYFTSHTDPVLGEAVREGRLAEFASFGFDEVPDPQAEDTFRRSCLQWELRDRGEHATLLDFHRRLLELRRSSPALRRPDKEQQEVSFSENERTLTLLRPTRPGEQEEELLVMLHLSERPTGHGLLLPPGRWSKELDSAEERWLGPGSPAPGHIPADGSRRLSLSPYSAVVFRREPTP